MSLKACVKCGFPKKSKFYGEIWLSQDGFCSVCNNKYKDRKRIKPFFKFKLKENVKYNNFDSMGNKLTPDRELWEKLCKKNKVINAGIQYNLIREKRKRRIDEYL